MGLRGRDILKSKWADGANLLKPRVRRHHSSCFSPFSLFTQLRGALQVCCLLSILVNYAICVLCRSRHQLALLSRLYIWTASIWFLLLNMMWICHESSRMFDSGGVRWWLTLGFCKCKMNRWYCVEWLQIKVVFIAGAGLSANAAAWRNVRKEIWCLNFFIFSTRSARGQYFHVCIAME